MLDDVSEPSQEVDRDPRASSCIDVTVDPIAEEIANDHFLAALLTAQARWLASHDRAALRRELLRLILELE